MSRSGTPWVTLGSGLLQVAPSPSATHDPEGQARCQAPVLCQPAGREEDTVVREVRLDLLLPALNRAVAKLLVLYGRDDLLVLVHAAGELVPELDEETRVVGLVLDRDRVVDVVLEARVQDGVVVGNARELVATVEVHAPDHGDETSGKVQHVQVEGHAKEAVGDGVHHDRVQGAHEVVHGVVGDRAEGRGVVVLVVVLVHHPQAVQVVAEVVPAPLVEVGDGNHHECREEPVAPRGGRVAVVPHRAVRDEVEVQRGHKGHGGRAQDAAQEQLPQDVGRGRVLRVALEAPLVIRGVHVVVDEGGNR
mmetsp:Transcript_64583/g.188941  ORF Transcript_64583/g.188941 Transcript_64583/m.188941 type:complete len:306 (+) Transcript_64583:159-1076(+)